jgi:septal ring factor EnvC (AmiA/AmiB activator)
MKKNTMTRQSMEKIEVAKSQLAEVKTGLEAIFGHMTSCRARKGDLINQESAAKQNLADAVAMHKNAVNEFIVKQVDPKQIEELKQGVLNAQSTLKAIRDSIPPVEDELSPLNYDAFKAGEYAQSAEQELWMAIFMAEKAKNGDSISESIKGDILRLFAIRNKAGRISLEQFMGDILDIKFNDEEAQRMAAEYLPEISTDYGL